MVSYILYTQGPRFVESHICQNRADMGHPSFVTDPAVRNSGGRPTLAVVEVDGRSQPTKVLRHPEPTYELAKARFKASFQALLNWREIAASGTMMSKPWNPPGTRLSSVG